MMNRIYQLLGITTKQSAIRLLIGISLSFLVVLVITAEISGIAHKIMNIIFTLILIILQILGTIVLWKVGSGSEEETINGTGQTTKPKKISTRTAKVIFASHAATIITFIISIVLLILLDKVEWINSFIDFMEERAWVWPGIWISSVCAWFPFINKHLK